MRTGVQRLCPKPSGRFSSLSAKAQVLRDLLVLAPFLHLLLLPPLSHGAPVKVWAHSHGRTLALVFPLQDP